MRGVTTSWFVSLALVRSVLGGCRAIRDFYLCRRPERQSIIPRRRRKAHDAHLMRVVGAIFCDATSGRGCHHPSA